MFDMRSKDERSWVLWLSSDVVTYRNEQHFLIQVRSQHSFLVPFLYYYLTVDLCFVLVYLYYFQSPIWDLCLNQLYVELILHMVELWCLSKYRIRTLRAHANDMCYVSRITNNDFLVCWNSTFIKRYVRLFHTIHISFQRDIRSTNKSFYRLHIWNWMVSFPHANDDDVVLLSWTTKYQWHLHRYDFHRYPHRSTYIISWRYIGGCFTTVINSKIFTIVMCIIFAN